MSLFTVREWWGATPGANEEFGGGCLAVGNLDNAADGGLKIATGSFAGLLRLYCPRGPAYRVEDLMLESMLDAPILQLAAGQVLSDTNRVALAVLHPRAIAVYSIAAVAGSKDDPKADASYFKLAKVFEHPLERPACNLVHGAFGGTYGHEQICIQSMDGSLTVVEQERVVLEKKLGKFLLPGPLTYCAKAVRATWRRRAISPPTPPLLSLEYFPAAPHCSRSSTTQSLSLTVPYPASPVPPPPPPAPPGPDPYFLLAHGGRVLQVEHRQRGRRLGGGRREETHARLVADRGRGGGVYRGRPLLACALGLFGGRSARRLAHADRVQRQRHHTHAGESTRLVRTLRAASARLLRPLA